MKKYLGIIGMALGLCLSSVPANAVVNIFGDDFEARGSSGATTLSSPWSMNKEVFDSSNGYVGGYYPGTVFGPNAVVAGGAGGSSYAGKVWPDYGYAPDWSDNKRVNVSLLVNRTLTAGDIADNVLQFDFDYLREGNPGAGVQATAWVKLLSPDFTQTWAVQTINLGLSSGWQHGAVAMTFDGTQAGANFQWGITASDVNYSGGAGILIDNVTVSGIPEPSSATLMGLGVAGLLAFRLRRKV